MKDGKSLLLLLISLGLVGTWSYHLYEKNQYQTAAKQFVPRDTTGMVAAIRDSLERVYALSVNEMGEKIDTVQLSEDSLKGVLDHRLIEIGKLRKEISRILGNKNITRGELRDAKNKILDLHSKVDDMTSQNNTLEQERTRLTGELTELNLTVKGLQENIVVLDSQNKELKEFVNSATTLATTNVKLSVVDAGAQGRGESETAKAKKASKIVISFIAENNIAQFANTEMYVILTAPDGTVITNEIWESGNFDTKKEKSRPFTRKLKFDYSRGEQKRLIFSLDYDKFTQGTYHMQLYHNGSLVGESSKYLG